MRVVRFGIAALLLSSGALCAPAAAQFRLPVKLDELERRAHADSNDPAAHFNVALGYWNAKRWKDADRSLRTAIPLDPRFAPAYVALHYLAFAERPSLWDEVQENRVPQDWQARLEEAVPFFFPGVTVAPNRRAT